MIGWGWWGATEWQGKQHVKCLYFQWASTKPNCCSKCNKK